MGTILDSSLNIKPQTAFGTPVTPDRAFPMNSGSLDWTPTIVTSQELRANLYMSQAARRIVVGGQGAGDLEMNVLSKGFGYWWQACMGSLTSTLVSTGVYQQLATWTSVPTPLTVQQATPRVDGTIDAITYSDVAVSAFTITFNNQGLLTLSVTLDLGKISTSTAFATLTYATTPNLFGWGNPATAQGFSFTSGTYTAPTTTALASGSTTFTGIRSLSITADRSLKNDRFNADGAGFKSQQIGGMFNVTGSLEVEYNSTAQRDSFLIQSEQCLVATATAGALTTGSETVQVAIPAFNIDSGAVPQPSMDLPVQTIPFTVLYDGSNVPFVIATRTADTAV